MAEEIERNLEKSFTPREIVSELDRFIIGQTAAKKAVAIALRNRWRRKKVDKHLRDEIVPKNIILMGPTGCGKTEIARRLAKLAQAPFVKVEATKFTEVGYVGRDVDSMIRDLAEVAFKICKEEALEMVEVKAQAAAEEKLLDILMPTASRGRGQGLPFDVKLGEQPREIVQPEKNSESRGKMRDLLRSGKMDDKEVSVNVQRQSGMPMMQMFGAGRMDEMASGLQEAIQAAVGGGTQKKRKMKIQEAIKVLAQQEGQKLIDNDEVQRTAVLRAEQSGIVFIDEIDKICSGEGGRGADVSREGVQRDILPVVEGSAVSTKYGVVRTDHVLFIAAGAFHMSKPSDLIPELQGRFPIRVELEALTESDFIQILTEPENSLVKQYSALLATESLTVDFRKEGIESLAKVAADANTIHENIGARRLYTVMEVLLEEVSFNAPDMKGQKIVVDSDMVMKRLGPVLENEDLSKFIL